MKLRTTVIILVGLLLALSWRPAFAQDTTPDDEEETQEADEPEPLDINAFLEAERIEATFAQLEQAPIELTTPSDAEEIALDLPEPWLVSGSAFIDVSYDMVYEGVDVVEGVTQLPRLFVYANEELALVFTPQPGEDQVERVSIPLDGLRANEDNRLILRFEYRSDGCDIPGAQLTIQEDTAFSLDFAVQPVTLSLADFPRPLVQNSFLPETVYLVIPDEFTEADLSNAGILAAALGAKAPRTTIVDTVLASDVDNELLESGSAIAVGTPENNAFIASLYQRGLLPTALSDDAIIVDGDTVEETVGVLQLAISNVNANYTFLVVTGSTDEAVENAARTLAGPDVMFGLETDIALIDEFTMASDPDDVRSIEEGTLAEFGLFNGTFEGIGTTERGFFFYVPNDRVLGASARVEVAYRHSAQLDPEASGITILLNNDPIGSLPITEGTIVTDQQAVITLPPDEIRYGTTNRLAFQVTTDLGAECAVDEDTEIAWVRIRGGESAMDLDLQPVGGDMEPIAFTNPIRHIDFAYETGVWLALTEEPSLDSVNTAINVVRGVANRRASANFPIGFTLGAEENPEDFKTYHAVAFGKPTENPLIESLNDSLPQPFLEGSDTLTQTIGSVVYSLPEDFSIGVIQVVPAPWNEDRGVTIVSGTSDEGVSWSFETVRTAASETINGDVAYIRGETIESLFSRDFTRSTLEEVVEEVTEEPVDLEVEPTPEAEPTPELLDEDEIPEEYLPQDDPPSQTTELAVYAMMGVGVLVGGAGIVFTVLRARRNTRSTMKDD